MYIWRVNYGWYNGTIDGLKNISDITFTDFNRPFTIIQSAPVNNYNGTKAGLITAMDNLFGNDYPYIYGAGYFKGASAVSIDELKSLLNDVIPSYTLSAPNLFEFEYTEWKQANFVYFISAKKLLCISSNTTTFGGRVFDVSDDGSLIMIADYPITCGYWTDSYSSATRQTDAAARFFVLLDASIVSDYYYSVTVNTRYNQDYGSLSFTKITNSLAWSTALFSDNPPDYDFPDDGPYGPGGNSGEGDLPPGTFDDTSDAIPDSSLPTISAADTGFTRIYNPTLAQVQSLAKYLWTDDTVLDTIWNHIKQFFEDPMQAIIGFNLVPCRVPDGGTRSFALMYIDTGVQMTAAASQFVDVDCGTVQLERYYGSALDQNPYTKISCYLPYIGTVHLDTDEVMGTTLQVKYRIDIVSGSCVAKILVDGNVLYQYSGHCAITIPISSADFASYVSAAVSVGAVAAGLAAGAAAGFGVGAAESEALTVTSAEMSAPITASEASALIGGENATGAATGASFNGINAANITNTVGQVMGSKLQIEHAGSFSGNSGYLGVRRPYLIINRPNMCLPSLYGHLNGYPSMITLNLSECSGFTKVQQVQLTGVTATNPEQSEILQFLKSGVYL